MTWAAARSGVHAAVTGVRIPATLVVLALALLAVIKLAMVNAGVFSLGEIAEVRAGVLPAWQADMGITFMRFAHRSLLVFELGGCALLAWWTTRLARAVGTRTRLSREHPSWYGHAWCVPVTNLWRPFHGIHELWTLLGGYTRAARWWWMAAWSTWVGYQVALVVGSLPMQPQDPVGRTWLMWCWILRDSTFVFGALFGIGTVVWLTTLHTQREIKEAQ